MNDVKTHPFTIVAMVTSPWTISQAVLAVPFFLFKSFFFFLLTYLLTSNLKMYKYSLQKVFVDMVQINVILFNFLFLLNSVHA